MNASEITWKATQLPRDELQDFNALIRASGRSPEDYKCTLEEGMRGSVPQSVARRLTVSTKYATKVYVDNRLDENGQPVPWLADFEVDLKASHFN